MPNESKSSELSDPIPQNGIPLHKKKIEWKEYKLGEVIRTNRLSIGKEYGCRQILYLDTGSITCNKVDGYQYFDLEDAPSRAKRLVEDEDIIYSSVRPNQLHYGFIKDPPNNLVVSTGFVTITCDKSRIAPKFLYYYLTQPHITEFLHTVAEASTSAYPSLKPSDIESLEIELPPLSEQKRIASILGSLDDKIDLLHRQNATLEAMAETLFRHHFIENPNPNWKEVSLTQVATFTNGLACQKYPPKNEVEKLPVLKIRELSNGIGNDSDWATTDVGSEYVVHAGDVIFAWSASLMVKIWDGEDCILNQHLFKVTSEKYPKWFYYFWCKHHLNEFISIAQSHATTMGHIKRKDLDSARVLVPSDDELLGYSDEISFLIQKMEVNNRAILQLTNLRSILLQTFFNKERE